MYGVATRRFEVCQPWNQPYLSGAESKLPNVRLWMGFPPPTSQQSLEAPFDSDTFRKEKKTPLRSALLSRRPRYKFKPYRPYPVSCVPDLFYARHKAALPLRFAWHSPSVCPLPASRSSVGIGGSVPLALKEAGDWSKPDLSLPPEVLVLFNCTSLL